MGRVGLIRLVHDSKVANNNMLSQKHEIIKQSLEVGIYFVKNTCFYLINTLFYYYQILKINKSSKLCLVYCKKSKTRNRFSIKSTCQLNFREEWTSRIPLDLSIKKTLFRLLKCRSGSFVCIGL